MPADMNALADDVAAETVALRLLVASLTEEGWRQATPAPGWTIADQVSHLAHFDEVAVQSATRPREFDAELARTDAAGAAELARLVRYPPAGTRSMSLGQPAGQYGLRSLEEYIETHNAQTLTVGQFETRDYASRLDKAIATLDVAFIGPMDLSVDLGHTGDLTAAAVQSAMAAIESAAARAGTPLGIFVGGREGAKMAVEKGYRYLLVSSDIGMLMTGARQALAEARA